MGGGGSGSSEELCALEAALRGSAEALCRYTHGFTAGAGPSLKESLRQLCSVVVDPSRELIARLKVRTGPGQRTLAGRYTRVVESREA